MMNPANSINSSIARTITINSSQLTGEVMSDDLSDEGSSPDSSFDASDLMDTSMSDDITNHLAAAGPIGVAAAAAINSGRKRKRPHLFETNPAIRKRQQTRLMRKLRTCIEEYTTRVGQQAVILCCTPSKGSFLSTFKVFGSQPLEDVIKKSKDNIIQELETSLSEQTPNSSDPNNPLSSAYELPTLALDGIPTPVDKMTQGQLRTFIPEMLRYSTCRSKPGWGKMECRPVWWPNDVPWASVRSDVRTDEEKKRVSWTEALRTIVKNCYKHHGREDLLNVFGDDSQQTGAETQAAYNVMGTMVQTINNPDGSVSIIQIDTGPNSVVTLPDGSQATVVHSVTAIPQENINQMSGGGGDAGGGAPEMETSASAMETVVGVQYAQPPSVELPTNLNINDGRIMLATGETIQLNTDPMTGLMTIPVSVYQRMIGAQQSSQNTVELGTSTPVVLQSQPQTQMLTQQSLDTIQHAQQQQHQQQQHPMLNVVEQHQIQGSQLAAHLTQDNVHGLGNISVVSVESLKPPDINQPS